MREAQAAATAPDHAAPQPHPPRTQASAARAAASRANGAKSRGPTTSQGKGRSRFNRLKHGLCAATTVLPGEDAAAFADRLAAWTCDLDPHSDLEGYFVADAVAASWRLDRGRRVEAVALTQHVATAATRFDDALTRQLANQVSELALGSATAATRLGRTVGGCRVVLGRWTALAAALQQRGRWSVTQAREVLCLLGHHPARQLSHPEVRHIVAAALALLYPARPAAEALAMALAGARLGTEDPALATPAEAAEMLRAEWPEPAAARRELTRLAAEQQSTWTARLAEVGPHEARARAGAAATAAVDLGASGEARLRYEGVHRRAFYGALKGLRDEQARRCKAADQARLYDAMDDLTPHGLSDDIEGATGRESEGKEGAPSPALEVEGAIWCGLAESDLTRAYTLGDEAEDTRALLKVVVERVQDWAPAPGAGGGAGNEGRVAAEEKSASGAERTRDHPVASGAEGTRDEGGRGNAGLTLSKALDASSRPRNRKERKRLAAMRRDIERAERRRPGGGTTARNEPERVSSAVPGQRGMSHWPTSPEALGRLLGEPPAEPILAIRARPHSGGT